MFLVIVLAQRNLRSEKPRLTHKILFGDISNFGQLSKKLKESWNQKAKKGKCKILSWTVI